MTNNTNPVLDDQTPLRSRSLRLLAFSLQRTAPH